MRKLRHIATVGAVALGLVYGTNTAAAKPDSKSKTIELSVLSSVAASTPPAPDLSPAEIVSHDPLTQRLFVVNARAARIDVFDIHDPVNPVLVGSIDVAPFGAVANSVAVKDGVIAVAVEANPKTNPGAAVFFDSALQPLSSVTVGAQPDMITFTPDGRFVLTANEGEPSNDYLVDPEGSVSVIDVSAGAANVTQANVRTAGFTAFNGLTRPALFQMQNIRVFGPNATVAQDLEPEYITTSHDSKTAWVTLQEANALAIIDVQTATVTRLVGLGTKDHTLANNGFRSSNAIDASDKDNMINIQLWPVRGFYMPDAIASYKVGNETYLVLANEGDARAYPGFTEEARVKELVLDPARFPTSQNFKSDLKIGRLRVTNANGQKEEDSDNEYETLYSFGGRSFSIRATNGQLLWDSGDQLEQITAATYPGNFNASNSNNNFDDRSDDKGPEPEGVTIGKAFGNTYAFIGLERIGGVVVYDISDPRAPFFVDYVNNRDFTKAPLTDPASGDVGPEGLIFISEENSPNGQPLVVVANEISGTTTILQVNKLK